MLAIILATVTGNPKPKCNDSLTGTQFSLKQNLFSVLLLKIFGKNLPMHLLCTVKNISPDDVILPKIGTYVS